MKRLREREALAILTEALERAGWSAASALTVQEGARPEADQLHWWHANTPTNESSDTKRNLAYLSAYARIGGPKLYAGGLFLDRKRLWMDRSVMSRLERDGYVSFEGQGKSEPWFELTDKGASWIES